MFPLLWLLFPSGQEARETRQCQGALWEHLHGEFVRIHYETKKVDRVLVSGGWDTWDAIAQTLGGQTYQDSVSETREKIVKKLENNPEIKSRSNLRESNLPTFVNVQESLSQVLFKYSTNAISRSIFSFHNDNTFAKLSEQAWSDFFEDEKMKSAEADITSCTMGSISFSTVKLLQQNPELFSTVFANIDPSILKTVYTETWFEHGLNDGETKPTESRQDLFSSVFARSVGVLENLSGGFGDFISTVELSVFVNTGWPVADLFAGIQEMLGLLVRDPAQSILTTPILPEGTFGSLLWETKNESDQKQILDIASACLQPTTEAEQRLLLELLQLLSSEKASGFTGMMSSNGVQHVAHDIGKHMPVTAAYEVIQEHQAAQNTIQSAVKCPLAHATAILTLAVSYMKNAGQEEFLFQRMKEVSGIVGQFLSVFQRPLGATVVLNRWPFWRLLSILDTQNPHARAEAIVIIGRLDRLEVLHHYLHQNLRINGGPLDKINFVIHNAIQDEIQFMNKWITAFPDYYAAPSVYGKRLAKFYSFANNPNTIYIKIDDDIVFASKNTFRDIIREKFYNGNDVSMVSANVVNHAILSAVHNELGAVYDEYGPTIHANITEESFDPWAPQIVKEAQAECVWKSWQCAEWVHRSFLHHYYSRTLEAFVFYKYNYHLYGYGNPKSEGGEIVPMKASRWSINLFAFRQADLVGLDKVKCADDDESQLSYVQPHKINKPAVAVGSAIVVHFSYGTQEHGLQAYTGLLNAYKNLTKLSYY